MSMESKWTAIPGSYFMDGVMRQLQSESTAVEMTKDELMAIITAAIPWPSKISDIDSVTEENAIRFTWFKDRYRVALNLGVEKVECRMLVSDNSATLLQALVQNEERFRKLRDLVNA